MTYNNLMDPIIVAAGLTFLACAIWGLGYAFKFIDKQRSK